jgi:hypothetical protein
MATKPGPLLYGVCTVESSASRIKTARQVDSHGTSFSQLQARRDSQSLAVDRGQTGDNEMKILIETHKHIGDFKEG